MATRPYRAIAIPIAATFLACCGGTAPSVVSSVALPGNAVISFANSPDRVNTTLILSKPAGEVAGVDGRIFTISSVTFAKPEDELTMDADGNMGLHGSYHSVSSKSEKKDIRSFTADATRLLERTRVVTFRYRNDSEYTRPHVGIVADEAPEPLTDEHHRSFDLNNSLAVTMAATRELDVRTRGLERHIGLLESEVRRLRAQACSHGNPTDP